MFVMGADKEVMVVVVVGRGVQTCTHTHTLASM